MAVEVKLLRPLDGRKVGSVASYPESDAKRLERRGAVEIIKGKAAPKADNKMEREPQNKAVNNASRKAT